MLTEHSLETEVIDSLEDLRYPNWESLKGNVSSISDLSAFSSIVAWLSSQLTQFNPDLDCVVNPITNPNDLKSFEIELNSLLKDMCSPFAGYGSQLNLKNNLSIINYLCGELLASRMNATNDTNDATNGSMSITTNESETGKDLKSVLISLEMGKPPPNVTSQVLFKKLNDKLKERLQKTNLLVEDSLLLPNALTLSPNQWKTLLQINNQFYNDYKLRRQMLLTRCDCSVNSFKWKSSKSDGKTKSENTENTELAKKLDNVYSTDRNNLSAEPNVSICDALVARESDCDLLLNSRISISHVPCIVKLPQTTGMANKGVQQLVQQDLHKFLIGTVPDRGGRPDEQPPPPKESFTQQQQQRDNPQRGRGGRGNFSGAGRGAGNVSSNQQQRVQGAGWAQNSGYDSRNTSSQSQDSGYFSGSKGSSRDQSYDNYQSGQQSYQSGGQQQRYNDNYHQTGHQRYGDSHQSGQQRFGDNYSSGQQRYTSGQHSYQQQEHYRGQQQFSSPYQMDYQPNDRRGGHNYSDNYGNTNVGDNYQQQYYSDATYYNQRDRNYNRGNRGRGGRR